MNQHRVVIFGLEKRFDYLIEVAEQRADRSRPLDLEKTADAVPMSVQIAALVVQLFVAMRRVKLVVLLDDHDALCCIRFTK